MENYKHWMALNLAKGLGIVSLKEIYETIKSLSLSITDIFSLNIEEIKNEFNFSNSIVNGIIEAQSKIVEIESDYCDLIDANIQPIIFFEKNYPEILLNKLKSNAPTILYTFGNIDLLNTKSAAILGHSEISAKGEMINYMAVKNLSEHNITVISGMSKGAGVIAHKSAMENHGNTIAVLPCGMFNFHMSEKLKELFDENRFLIVSPFYPGEQFSKFNAYNRNRLICALSQAVYIVEAPEDEGIFEAGKSALKLNVPLFTTQYAEYPESAIGNKKLLSEYNATGIRGKKEGTKLIPNLDSLIAKVKLGS